MMLKLWHCQLELPGCPADGEHRMRDTRAWYMPWVSTSNVRTLCHTTYVICKLTTCVQNAYALCTTYETQSSNDSMPPRSRRCLHTSVVATVSRCWVRMAHSNSYSWLDGHHSYVDNRGNSRANTCAETRLLGRAAFISYAIMAN